MGQAAFNGMSDAQKRAIARRMQPQQPPVTPSTPLPADESGRYHKPNEARQQGYNRRLVAEKTRYENGDTKTVPIGLVKAAVRAVDVKLPEEMENYVTKVTTMYLNKMSIPDIATELDIPVEDVKVMIVNLDKARLVSYKQAPNLAAKVVEAHFDVMSETIATIAEANEILAAAKQEMMEDHNARHASDPFDVEGDEVSDGAKGKPKRRYKGVSPMKMDAYFRGLEVTGKQVDRIANILGLLNKNMPKGDTQINQILQQTLNFNSPELNSMVNSLMLQAGNTPITPAEAANMVIDVGNDGGEG